MPKKKRSTCTASVTPEGIQKLRRFQKENGVTQETFAKQIYSSLPTYKRLLKGESIKVDTIRAAFEQLDPAFNVNDVLCFDKLHQEQDVEKLEIDRSHDIEQNRFSSKNDYFEGKTKNFSFMITGTFCPSKLLEIQCSIQHLESLLKNNCTITLKIEKNSLAITGCFDEKLKPHIEIAIQHLEKLMLEYYITPS